MNDILDDILTVLKNRGSLKAPEIAKTLGKTKSEVNSTLYKAIKTMNGLEKSDTHFWSYTEYKVIKISFDCSAAWLNAAKIEQKLKQYPDLIHQKCEIEFNFSNKFLFLDCILKILSLVNQLATAGAKVTIRFDEDSNGFNYLQRCGFFDNILEAVTILPYRPEESLAKKYNSNSAALVEIFPIKGAYEGSELPRLKECISAQLSEEENEAILKKISHLISELITNIRDHGQSKLDGYVVLQMYNMPNAKKIVVSVSDSGLGLLTTLRNEASKVAKYKDIFAQLNSTGKSSDVNLLTYILNHGGISRTGLDGRGMGLERSSKFLAKISSEDTNLRSSNLRSITLSIRQNDNEITFPYGEGALISDQAKLEEGLVFLQGTHYVLTIILDKV